MLKASLTHQGLNSLSFTVTPIIVIESMCSRPPLLISNNNSTYSCKVWTSTQAPPRRAVISLQPWMYRLTTPCDATTQPSITVCLVCCPVGEPCLALWRDLNNRLMITMVVVRRI